MRVERRLPPVKVFPVPDFGAPPDQARAGAAPFLELLPTAGSGWPTSGRTDAGARPWAWARRSPTAAPSGRSRAVTEEARRVVGHPRGQEVAVKMRGGVSSPTRRPLALFAAIVERVRLRPGRGPFSRDRRIPEGRHHVRNAPGVREHQVDPEAAVRRWAARTLLRHPTSPNDYRTCFSAPFPARTTIQAALPRARRSKSACIAKSK